MCKIASSTFLTSRFNLNSEYPINENIFRWRKLKMFCPTKNIKKLKVEGNIAVMRENM